MLPIERGKKSAGALKAVCYGPEGVGKTKFASQWPNPVFLDLENGSLRYDVARMPKPRNFKMLLDELGDVASNPNEVGTIIIDTADAAELLYNAAIVEEHKDIKAPEDIPYGRGYVAQANKMQELLAALDKCVDAGVNALVLAHAQIKKFEQPDELGAYDRYELKLSKKCAPLLKEWCDLLLFANFKTDVMKDDAGKTKATGGTKRVMYTQHTAAYDAKNRLDLKPKLPFEFASIAEHVAGGTADGDIVEEPVIAQPDELEPSSNQDEPQSETDAPEPEPESNVPDLLAGAVIEDVTPENVRKLHRLMERDGINEATLAAAVAARPKTRYTENDRIRDYSEKFIDSLVTHWDSVAASAKELAPYAQDDIPF